MNAGPILEDLRSYLTLRIPSRAGIEISNIERIGVGWSHETILFNATWSSDGNRREQGFVVRLDPGTSLLRHLSSLEQQFKVLQSLKDADVPVPQAFWFEPDEQHLGAPFLVMERLPGECPSPWNRKGRQFYEEAAERGVLPGSFTDALARLHTVDWHRAGLDFLGVATTGTNEFARREVAKWRSLLEVCEVEPEPIVMDLLGWLDANAPVTEHLVLVHASYRTGNLLIHNDHVEAILDWETPCIGDPMYDVAYVISKLNRGDSSLLSYVVTPEQFRRQYEERTGFTIDLETCRYYDLLYGMRSAVFWMSASGLFVSGKNPDLRLARTTYSLPVVLDQAARQLGY